jgi:transcriptional regulator
VPPKRKIDLPDHVRAAVLADVHLDYDSAADALERSKIRIHLAIEQGLTTYEIAEDLGVSQAVVSKWSRQGKEAFENRESARSQPAGGDSGRSGEREPVG